jgi:hypothetical protein
MWLNNITPDQAAGGGGPLGLLLVIDLPEECTARDAYASRVPQYGEAGCPGKGVSVAKMA